MKTTANYRTLAIMFIATFICSGLRAQNRNRVNSDADRIGNRNEKVEQNKHNTSYTYKNYNYSNYHHKKNGPVVFNNRPVKFKNQPVYHKRLPVQMHPHLLVQQPGNLVAVHIDGFRYFVNNGRFYRNIPGKGFVLVERPAHIRELPAGVVKVRIKGNFYFKYQSILFEWTPWGYRIV